MHGQWDKPRFRKLLAEAMVNARLSQREVADLAGVSHSQVSRWMSGAHRPGYENVRQLGAALLRERPGSKDVTLLLLTAAGYDAQGRDTALALVESVGMEDGDDGPPWFEDPEERRIAAEVWEDNARMSADPALRRGVVALAIKVHREKSNGGANGGTRVRREA